jgi:hypothetical protein
MPVKIENLKSVSKNRFFLFCQINPFSKLISGKILKLTGFSIFGKIAQKEESQELFSIFPEISLLNGLIWQN